MSLVNLTPFVVQDAVIPDHRGRDVVVAIAKAAFDVSRDGMLSLVEKAIPVRLGDECWEEGNPRSSIRFPSELCTEKVGTDVVVVGEAVSARPVTAMDVAVKVRGTVVPLRVHGERFFYQGIGNVMIGPAAPFTRKAIVYEKAYGGATDDYVVREDRNLSGVGVARRPKDLVDQPAPQIEHPARPHKSASDAHPPVGFGAIWSHWSPRREMAGTMDDTWVRDRMPVMPADFDLRANNVAHPTLQFDPPLSAGDVVAINGMSEQGLFRFRLPRVPLLLTGRFDGSGRRHVRPLPDLVLVLPGESRVEIVSRCVFPLGRARNVLREIRAELEGPIETASGGG